MGGENFLKVFWKGVRVNGMGNVKIENFVARGGATQPMGNRH